MEKKLHKLYYNPADPAGLSSIAKLRIGLKKESGVNPTISTLKKFLYKQDAYTLHAMAGKNFRRNRVLVSGIDKQFQMDLVDMTEYAPENDNTRYLLTCIDVFSKYAWVRPLVNKTGPTVSKAFKDILSEGRTPLKVQTDDGGEFFNKHFQHLTDLYKIVHFSTGNETKASVVERFNRTLKSKMWRYLTSVNSRRYIDVIQDLVCAYNNSYHRSIKMAPIDVNKTNEKIVFINLYKKDAQRSLPVFKFNVGDTVRLSYLRGVFRKGYQQTFTDEFFTITKRIARDPVVYKLEDATGDEIKGTFYEAELQQVIIDKNKTFKIEQILKRKTVKGKKLFFVKWLGWPAKFSSWVHERDVINL